MGKVYLIKCDNKGYVTYKIGITTRSGIKRIKEMQTGNPGIFTIEHEFDTPNHLKLESTLHRIYSKFRVKGEWFSTDLNIEEYKENCRFYNNNINMLKKANNPYI